MSWCVLDVRSTEVARHEIAAWLVRRTGQAVEERDDGSLVGVTTPDSADAVLAELRHRFQGISVVSRDLPARDWSVTWREGLEPRRVGRLLITPSWRATGEGDSGTIIIDPETAFGTGEHGSTRGALQLLDRWLQPGARVLDLGSGSGILSIAAVKLGADRAIGVDLDPEVEPIARANAARNHADQATEFLTGDAGILTDLLARRISYCPTSCETRTRSCCRRSAGS